MRDYKLPTTAFITGSHAYGTPREDSDIDIVVLVDFETAEELERLSKAKPSKVPHRPRKILLDNVNLVVCTSEFRFGLWKNGTAKCVRKAPITREEAIEIIGMEYE